jgi:DNA-binding NarL/FixJ family response regulator
MEALTTRENEVLRLTARDCLSAKEIAAKLFISPTTAQNAATITLTSLPLFYSLLPFHQHFNQTTE